MALARRTLVLAYSTSEGSPVVSAALAPIFAVIAAIDFRFFAVYARSASLGTAARTRRLPGTAS